MQVPLTVRDFIDRAEAVYPDRIAFCVNNEVLKAKNLPMPTSWEDLLDPVYEGEIVMPNPASSGTGSTGTTRAPSRSTAGTSTR